jgi:hypothetical protein
VNHSAPAWQNPSFGRNSFANPFQPPQYQPSPHSYPQPPPWQSQTFQAQNVERRPVKQHPIPPPPLLTKVPQLHRSQPSSRARAIPCHLSVP